jgi:hypothetical protein
MEYSARDLTPDLEPHAYGLEIETLTDACGLVWDNHHDPSGDRHKADTPPRKRGKPSDSIDPTR